MYIHRLPTHGEELLSLHSSNVLAKPNPQSQHPVPYITCFPRCITDARSLLTYTVCRCRADRRKPLNYDICSD
jgi:hypothetical protein